ncbi:hypothetical protein [Streptomyces sp. NPDC101393]|uniref:hypothetical protein n=1 Tax=Streptomyces sp. NPDC101393 TaxID=3366141 RepID=UPI00382F47EC
MPDPTRTSQSTRHAAGPIGASARTPAAAVAPASRLPVAALARLLITTAALTGLTLPARPRPLFSLTVVANLAVMVAFAWSAHRAWTGRRPVSPRITAGVVLLIALTGLVPHLAPAALAPGAADHLPHTVTPLAALADWLLLTRPRRFRRPYVF